MHGLCRALSKERARLGRALLDHLSRSCYATPAAFSVARTRAGVIGASWRRTPVASKNAFAIAAATGAVGGSPEPVGCRSVRCTTTVVTVGWSLKRSSG